MLIRVIRAASMPQAMALIRQQLGPDAVLLSSRRVGEGVEVTAGAEPDPDDEPLLIAPLSAPPPPPPLVHVSADAAAIAFHNLPPSLAQRLAAGPLEETLAASLRFAPLPDGIARPLLLAGPSGAGKTLTCAKLAARRLLGGGSAPLVITTDGERAGAAEQLAAFTRVLGATLAVAPTPGAAVKALARRAEGQPALIDTSGLDPFLPDSARALSAIIAATDATVALVLPAGLDAAEASDLARAFAALGATHLVPTRLDAARRLGAVLAAARAAGLTLAEAGTGPQAASDLVILDPAWLAQRLRRRSHHEHLAAQGSPP
jgi:flagellar biosynthesis protein FlhF